MNTTKLDKLKAVLGDLTKYRKCHWVYSTENNRNHGWYKTVRKNKILMESPPNDMETKAIQVCHCSTPITKHFLIQNVDTEELFFIGTDCYAKYIDPENKLNRTCIQCNKPNKCISLRCKNCRVECPIHKEFHDDNSICSNRKEFNYDSDYYDSDDDIKPPLPTKPQISPFNRAPSFKCKYTTLEKLFSDSGYMNWLKTKEWFYDRPESDLYIKFLQLMK